MDTVEEQVSITTLIDSLQINDEFQLEARFTNNVGQPEDITISWLSLSPEIVQVNDAGLVTGLGMGTGQVMASVNLADKMVSDTVQFVVSESETAVAELIITGEIKTTTFYDLEGSFELEQVEDDLVLTFEEDYTASSSLPGLYLYLTNNPNSIGNAREVAMVEVFSGAHSYTIEDVGLMEYEYLLYYCKPFGVKVGDGKIGD